MRQQIKTIKTIKQMAELVSPCCGSVYNDDEIPISNCCGASQIDDHDLCKECKEHLPITKFQFRNDSKKYRPSCNKCRTLSNKEYLLKNPDKYKEKIIKAKIYYNKNLKWMLVTQI